MSVVSVIDAALHVVGPLAPSARHRTADPARLSVVDRGSGRTGAEPKRTPRSERRHCDRYSESDRPKREAPDHPKVLLVQAEREGSAVLAVRISTGMS